MDGARAAGGAGHHAEPQPVGVHPTAEVLYQVCLDCLTYDLGWTIPSASTRKLPRIACEECEERQDGIQVGTGRAMRQSPIGLASEERQWKIQIPILAEDNHRESMACRGWPLGEPVARGRNADARKVHGHRQ